MKIINEKEVKEESLLAPIKSNEPNPVVYFNIIEGQNDLKIINEKEVKEETLLAPEDEVWYDAQATVNELKNPVVAFNIQCMP